MDKVFDFAVIGGGIAGASVAAELQKNASVLLVEMESQPGYHTTGRSAAMFAPGYGPAPIRALTRASGAFFQDPPDGFTENALVTPRNVVMVAREEQLPQLDALVTELDGEAKVERLGAKEMQSEVPLLKEGYAAGGMLDSSGSDIDVGALHQGYLRVFKGLGGELRTRSEVRDLSRDQGVWTLDLPAGAVRAAIVVDAAGAWADQVGTLAGAQGIGLVPKRRTALMIAAPEGVEVDELPLTVDIDEDFYLKPDAGRLLISPANEDPTEPCDAQPEELDIAYCIDRIVRAFDLSVRRIENRWAGLRSFVADKVPVAGFCPQTDGFFWLAGQGGYGIQTSPALARVAAALAQGQEVPQDIINAGVDVNSLSPGRGGLAG